ncbi:hypothetical protein Tco_0632684 [Tanacetum coccineum]
MDPNYPVFANTLETYDAYFQDDRERYIRSYQEYEQYMALCEQEAGGSGSGTGSRSSPKKRAYIPRQRETAEERLIDDYFGDEEIDPKYTEENFRRRYRMSSTLFWCQLLPHECGVVGFLVPLEKSAVKVLTWHHSTAPLYPVLLVATSKTGKHFFYYASQMLSLSNVACC